MRHVNCKFIARLQSQCSYRPRYLIIVGMHPVVVLLCKFQLIQIQLLLPFNHFTELHVFYSLSLRLVEYTAHFLKQNCGTYKFFAKYLWHVQ